MRTYELADAFIRLEAVDHFRGIARQYEVRLSQDLFGCFIVSFAWGRIGTKGQTRQVSFEQHCDADRFVRKLLQRRGRAPKRIGIPYRVVAKSGACAPLSGCL